MKRELKQLLIEKYVIRKLKKGKKLKYHITCLTSQQQVKVKKNNGDN